MQENPNKFKFNVVKTAECVESSICSLIQSYSNESNKELEKQFRTALTSFNITLHSRILERNLDLLIIETSKFNIQTKQFLDHELWIFNKYQTTEITLNRYRI